ncbi:MAG: AAA family ATPase [Thermoplasmatales archaeon]|nr:AAA family ATPase [Thermoplasmatales archaeon]MCW6170390.1 AAA family ATPase [Thermoplasmatales archaeon]
MIKRVIASNFKSFESLDINLSNLNVVIGQNSAGKSNYVSIFQFIRDIATIGLNNAISLQGGIEYLMNFKNYDKSNLEIEIQFDDNRAFLLGPPPVIRFSDFSYKIILYPSKEKKGIKEYVEVLSMKGYKKGAALAQKSVYKLILENGRIRWEGDKEAKERVLSFPESLNLKFGTLLRIPPLSLLLGFTFGAQMQVYDFDPKLSRKAIPITGRAELEPDGSNTTLLIKNLKDDPKKWKEFIRYLKVCLPFIKDVSVENQADKSILFKALETYDPNTEIPAPLISDGTIEIVSTIYALFFEKKDLIVLEEPERNIHPKLISSVMHLIEEASRAKQIIVTTHSPEIVRQVGIKNLYVIDRDENGYSKLMHASDIGTVKAFLRDKIGVEELFIDGILT